MYQSSHFLKNEKTQLIQLLYIILHGNLKQAQMIPIEEILENLFMYYFSNHTVRFSYTGTPTLRRRLLKTKWHSDSHFR